MRIWSLHPKYLDTKGLVAVWRETLLAKHVLEGKTKGYKHHPQLDRFKVSANPLETINYYLAVIHGEACNRQYTFNKEKVDWNFKKAYCNRWPVELRGKASFEQAENTGQSKISPAEAGKKF
jgi:hypothetical protein